MGRLARMWMSNAPSDLLLRTVKLTGSLGQAHGLRACPSERFAQSSQKCCRWSVQRAVMSIGVMGQGAHAGPDRRGNGSIAVVLWQTIDL